MFTPQHYRHIADTLRAARPEPTREIATVEWEYTCRMFVNSLLLDNPRFRPAQFLSACGYQGPPCADA